MKPSIAISLIFLPVLFTGCSGCSISGRKIDLEKPAAGEYRPEPSRSEQPGEENVVKMEKINGVYQIPVEIDGVAMYFIFDTGAGIISISETEALFLYKQGKLKDTDITGSQNFVDANGDISQGTLITLRSVKIGNRYLYDVPASVVHNLKAPLLVGQSVLERFGNISIDYTHGQIVFK